VNRDFEQEISEKAEKRFFHSVFSAFSCSNTIKHFLREPLLHFLFLGAAIFVVHGLVSQNLSSAPQDIVVTSGKIENLAATFARTWQRPPTQAELDGLIQDYVREEACSREATALGLDRDDTVIRRRLRQKLEFVAEDLAAPAEPNDDELRTYLQAHPQAFASEPQFSFRQIYLSPERHRQNLAQDAERLLAELQRASDTSGGAGWGDPFLLPHEFENTSSSEIKNLFGEKFVAGLETLQPGAWQGPLASGYGVHLVLVTQRTEGRVPALAEVRETVRREWANMQRLAASEKFYQELLRRYTVIIEKPPEGKKELAVTVP